MATLSVSISRSGSPASTYSPGFLNHCMTVPFSMAIPAFGMITSVAIDSPYFNSSRMFASIFSGVGTAFRSSSGL